MEMNGRDNERYEKITIKKLMKMVMCTATITILQISTTVRTMLALHTSAISSTHHKDVNLERVAGTVM
jgi:hypothetical protein